jgi:hypothetical protein
MKTIPLADSANMANDSDVYAVYFDADAAVEWAEDGEYVTNFDDWLRYSSDAQLDGYGRNSGRKLWAVNREIQRQIYRICKVNAVEVQS